MNSVSPTNTASPMTKAMQAGVWPGTWRAIAGMPPTANSSPSTISRSNCEPSRANASGSLNTLANVLCTVVMSAPMTTCPPSCSFKKGAAERWSAWAWVSRIQSIDNPSDLTKATTASADPVWALPDAWSKSSTESTIAARRVSGSKTTWVAVKVGPSKNVLIIGTRPAARVASIWVDALMIVASVIVVPFGLVPGAAAVGGGAATQSMGLEFPAGRCRLGIPYLH